MLKGFYLTLKVIQADLTEDSGDVFGKSDPYCQVIIGNETHKSSIKDGAGKKPYWNESFDFKVFNSYLAEFKIMDHDTGSDDDFLGSGQ